MSNIQLVKDFIEAWNNKDWDAIEAAFAEDVIWHNIPMEPIQGRQAAAAAARGMQPDSVDWELLNISETGNTVLTERVDNFVMPGGKEISLPLMGAFEMEDGKIKEWRDYFDLATFTNQMAG